eukprot:3550731-Amphidinium_carterae.1
MFPACPPRAWALLHEQEDSHLGVRLPSSKLCGATRRGVRSDGSGVITSEHARFGVVLKSEGRCGQFSLCHGHIVDFTSQPSLPCTRASSSHA